MNGAADHARKGSDVDDGTFSGRLGWFSVALAAAIVLFVIWVIVS